MSDFENLITQSEFVKKIFLERRDDFNRSADHCIFLGIVQILNNQIGIMQALEVSGVKGYNNPDYSAAITSAGEERKKEFQKLINNIKSAKEG